MTLMNAAQPSCNQNIYHRDTEARRKANKPRMTRVPRVYANFLRVISLINSSRLETNLIVSNAEGAKDAEEIMHPAIHFLRLHA